MNSTQIYIVLFIAVLIGIATLFLFLGKDQEKVRLSPIAILAFVFVLAGILLAKNRVVGYSLMGVGGVLLAIDFFRKDKDE